MVKIEHIDVDHEENLRILEKEFEGRVGQEKVREIYYRVEESGGYENAPVKNFLTILIMREARSALQNELTTPTSV